ncbi:hypothetical protein HN018_28145 (plasmid) [Lichenicola cladoniae]|uniref:Large polyvalent protein-associated domain-containing protein n=1 Tax=Lichenicola cladoniae TaxID=1484109 RepID=A0A6M8I1A3_9PROT|nr:LPD7 domain-containing protein [Lichenicola cladoniae]NPD70341.1 hypothetical protein [Acetobacteraceae bacterium]QKE93997.1 hypothetical protein HN018_28145 [Lichenicola cladoniae]
MALLDRIKDATKPTNTVEEVKQRQDQAPPPDLHRASPAGPSVAPQGEARKAASEAKAPAYAAEPEAIRRAYYVEEQGSQRRYYDDYKKTALAIRADDTAISSKREDLTTIRAILTLAESRGWQEVKVNGSAEFKREAWIEAAARGITAQGYKASDVDRQEADRRRAEQGPSVRPPPQAPEGNEVRQAASRATPAPSPASPTVLTPTPQAPAQQAPSTEKQAPGSPTPRPPVAERPEAGPKVEPNAAPAQQDPASPKVDHRKALREATAELSQDGRLVLAAVSGKIDREINRVGNEGKAELKAYFATELLKKERAEGPVVLSPELKRVAAAPEPAQQQKAAEPERQPERQVERQPERRIEPEEPRRTRRR